MTDFTIAKELSISVLRADTVVHVSADSNLVEVADVLTAACVGALVLGDGEKVEGVVSERDVVRALADRRSPVTTRAMDVASTNLVWCDANAPIADVATEMMDRYVRHVLVEEDGKLVGIVSARDLLGFYAAADAD